LASRFAAKYDPVTPNMMVETTFLIQICSAIFYLVGDCSYSSFFLMLVYLRPVHYKCERFDGDVK
jgi:hypothetical protein